MVSIIETCCDEAKRQKLSKIGLLGTIFTMKGDFFKKPFDESGIEAVILGCTELPLLLNDEVSPVPCLDTMKIHVQTLVDRIVTQL